MAPAAKTTRAAGWGAAQFKHSRHNNFPQRNPWSIHAAALRSLAGDSTFRWGFAAARDLVDAVRLLERIDAGLLRSDGEACGCIGDLLGSVAEYAAGAHADADFAVGRRGAITVTASIDPAQLVLNQLDERDASSVRRHRGAPRVMMIDRSSGKTREVGGLRAVFHALVATRDEAHRVVDEAAWAARHVRLGDLEVF